MRLITKKFVEGYFSKYPTSKASLLRWIAIVEDAEWADVQDLRSTFPSADPVKVKSGKTVTVFNISGNNYRLITAIHYNTKIIFTLDFLTHAEYDKEAWKENL